MSKFPGATTGATRFLSESVDGWDYERFCIDGDVHVLRLCNQLDELNPWNDHEPCDGSCRHRPTRDLREMIAQFREGGWMTDSGRVVPDALHLDGPFRELLESAEPLIGTLFEQGYCKRRSRWVRVCLGGMRHVSVTTEFTWARDPEGGHVHRVRTSPCDGSCKPAFVELTLDEKRQLDESLREV